MSIKNVSAPKNSKGTSATPRGASNMGATPGGGTKPMPRVGGHTTNNAPGQGASGGPYGGKTGS